MIDYKNLTDYVEQERLPLIRKTVFAAPSTKYFNLQTGVKHAAALNILNTTVEFGDGATCGWDEAGTSELSQRVLEVGNFKVNMSFCDKSMLKYWAGYDVRVAAGQKSLPFEEEFVGGVIDGIKKELESKIWTGVKATDKIDGILTLVDSEAVKVTGADAYAATLAAYNAIPVGILGKAAIFMGADTFRALVLDLTAKNLYHYNPTVDEAMTIVLPGTNTMVHAVAGLNGTNKIVAANPENIYYGVDMEGDEERFDLWYSKDNQEFRLAINFNAGVQVAFPDEVVIATIQ